MRRKTHVAAPWAQLLAMLVLGAACLCHSGMTLAAQDTDADGVPDFKDACPGSPRGVQVAANGCAKTSSLIGGVIEPKGTLCLLTTQQRAYPEGCTNPKVPKIYFDFDSAYVSLTAKAQLSELADTLAGAKLKLVLRGHTDVVGSREYNWRLSQERAENVAAILRRDLGLAYSDLELVPLGASEPEASNASAGGRQLNRRVEILVDIE